MDKKEVIPLFRILSRDVVGNIDKYTETELADVFSTCAGLYTMILDHWGIRSSFVIELEEMILADIKNVVDKCSPLDLFKLNSLTYKIYASVFSKLKDNVYESELHARQQTWKSEDLMKQRLGGIKC